MGKHKKRERKGKQCQHCKVTAYPTPFNEDGDCVYCWFNKKYKSYK